MPSGRGRQSCRVDPPGNVTWRDGFSGAGLLAYRRLPALLTSAGVEALRAIGVAEDFAVEATEDPAAFTADRVSPATGRWFS